MNISPEARSIDDKVGYAVTVIGIPSAFMLHGYVGFIFGSIKANPWWSTPLMPIVFLFSAMVSGIAAVLLLYMASMKLKKTPIDMRCLDTIAKYLFYTFVIDFTLEMLDLIHRTYEADESFRSLDFMVHTRLCGTRRSSCRSAWAPWCRSPCWPPISCGSCRECAPGDVRDRVLPDHGRHLRHALERRHRRPVILQEFPRLHDLQSRLRHRAKGCSRRSR